MALFHTVVKVVQRSAGRSAVAAAAYRATDKLFDERRNRHFDYRTKTDNFHSQIMLPPAAPDRLADRETLWNEVERDEKRKDSQLAREVEFALPKELDDAQNIELARSMVQEFFVNRGMVADLNLHRGMKDATGNWTPHAHVLLTMRTVSGLGFGPKETSWNSPVLLQQWREFLAVRTNAELAKHGHDVRVDHRSFKTRGLALEPQPKIGPAQLGRHYSVEVKTRNTAKIIRDPTIVLETITEQQSTFSHHDLARFVARHTRSADDFRSVLAKVEAHPDLVRLGARLGDDGQPDGQGERYSTRAMRLVEQRLAAHARELVETSWHGMHRAHMRVAVESVGLGIEQKEGLRHLLDNHDLKLLVGYAGTGKSKLLLAAREGWEHAGWRVRGAALSGIAAEGLEGASGIVSRTIASWEYAWQQGRELLERKDVLVIDEAGMIGSRQMERVLGQAAKVGAKVVLIGDGEQLQAIEAGASFKALVRRHGAATLTQVRRQRSRWQQAATKDLATAHTGRALGAYAQAGMIHASPTREQAAVELVERWATDRALRPGQSQILLAYTRADVQALNDLARATLVASGELQGGRTVTTERGKMNMAVGDRLIFLRNDRVLGVKNGTLGTVTAVSRTTIGVRLDRHGQTTDGVEIKVDLTTYGHVDHGYAATIHKAQGVTVRQAYVLASRYFDRHASYVALTRHQSRVELGFGQDEFKDAGTLAQVLARPRAKDTTLDYAKPQPSERDLSLWKEGVRELLARAKEWARDR